MVEPLRMMIGCLGSDDVATASDTLSSSCSLSACDVRRVCEIDPRGLFFLLIPGSLICEEPLVALRFVIAACKPNALFDKLDVLNDATGTRMSGSSELIDGRGVGNDEVGAEGCIVSQ